MTSRQCARLVLHGGLLLVLTAGNLMADEKRIPVTISGGHETDPQDGGRPVVLIAGALGVPPEVFREAFRGVRPAQGRGPTPQEARRNKDALLKVLRPHGITNERLDEVSDYYRYRPQAGELWPTIDAKAYAVIEDGKIKSIVVTEHGSGYSSPPTLAVKGFEKTPLKAVLEYGKTFTTNGSLARVEIGTASPKKPAGK